MRGNWALQACGFTGAEADPADLAGLEGFITAEHFGDMAWLARDDGRRGRVHGCMANAQTAIVLAMTYGPGQPPPPADRGDVSVYARGKDYHDVFKKRLKALARWLVAGIRRRSKSLCRHRASDGKAPGSAGWRWLAGQAHQFGEPKLRLVVLFRRSAHRLGH